MVKNKAKNKDKPKRPMTAFLLYARDRRNIIRMNHPTAKISVVTTMIAEEWRGLDVKEKMPYITEAAEKKEKYREDLNTFLTAQGESI
jgi:acyl carrier protein phosphodiesterase